MARLSKKSEIVEQGLQLVLQQGFAQAGVQDITDAAGVPKGSFYNHFASKDAFGAEIVDVYFGRMRTMMADLLGDATRPPLARLEAYFDAIFAYARDKSGQGCMISTLCAEANGAADVLRDKLNGVLGEWRAPIAACIAEAQKRGDLAPAPDADTLARFVVDAWQGAMIRTKVSRDLEPLETFQRVVFGGVLVPLKRRSVRPPT
ncbi:MAG: TetR family transcriptional regulator C-terminal domain-containing protein [Telmatospirillum sp.]|nr:TetR family transcriptional regulator C-terminal domain-containing protein [Telmatospirillum sp.]